MLHRLRGEYKMASEYGQQSLDLRQATGDRVGMPLSIVELGMAMFVKGNLEEAERYRREAYLLAKEERAWMVTWLGIELGGLFALGKQGNIQEARSLVEEGLTTAHELTMSHLPRLHRIMALNFLSLIECMNDDYAKARTLGEEARRLASGDPWEPMYRWGLLAATCGQHDYAAAAAHTRFLLQHFFDRRVNTWLLVGVAFAAILAAYRDQSARRATELLALAFTHPHSLTGWLHVWSLMEELQQHLRIELGEVAYNAAWERGKLLVLETVVRDLLAEYRE
jgi:tetratricopeptide (TPR) repeat protein